MNRMESEDNKFLPPPNPDCPYTHTHARMHAYTQRAHTHSYLCKVPVGVLAFLPLLNLCQKHLIRTVVKGFDNELKYRDCWVLFSLSSGPVTVGAQ